MTISPRRSITVWAGLLIATVLGAGLVWSAGQVWRVGYPGAQQPGALGGIRLTTLGLGRCLTVDQHFITPDSKKAVSGWLEAHGWRPIIPLTPVWQIGVFVFGRYYYAAGGRRGPTEVLQRQAFCLGA